MIILRSLEGHSIFCRRMKRPFLLTRSGALVRSMNATYLQNIYMHRSDGIFSTLVQHCAKTKVRQVVILEMLLADKSALPAHSEEELQRLIDLFAHVYSVFGFTIRLNKNNIMGQEMSNTSSISIGDFTLQVVEDFLYFCSTTSSNAELSKRN